MKNKNDRIGLIDTNDKELENNFKNVNSKLEGLKKELEKINKVFLSLKAQDRLILFDVLSGALIDMSKLSTFLITSVLTKYSTNLLTGIVNKPISMPIISEGIDTGSKAEYIG
jgi:hypothetical protein